MKERYKTKRSPNETDFWKKIINRIVDEPMLRPVKLKKHKNAVLVILNGETKKIFF